MLLSLPLHPPFTNATTRNFHVIIALHWLDVLAYSVTIEEDGDILFCFIKFTLLRFLMLWQWSLSFAVEGSKFI